MLRNDYTETLFPLGLQSPPQFLEQKFETSEMDQVCFDLNADIIHDHFGHSEAGSTINYLEVLGLADSKKRSEPLFNFCMIVVRGCCNMARNVYLSTSLSWTSVHMEPGFPSPQILFFFYLNILLGKKSQSSFLEDTVKLPKEA